MIEQYFSGQLAIVTGGASGIGEGICRVLSARGARVACVDLDLQRAEQLALSIGGGAFAVRHDVTDWASAPVLVKTVEEHAGGPIEILVNNAGIYFSTPIDELEQERHERLFQVNVGGVLGMCKAVIPSMKQRARGKIVNVASISGRDPFPRSSSYGSSKSAVIGITKSLAKEVGPNNINVNAVCPGFVHTQMQIDQCRRVAQATGQNEDEVWQSRVDLVPLRRAQTVEDIGEAVSFLASDRARSITGQSISVCGGLQMHN